MEPRSTAPAWQPLTFGGAAAFAQERIGRLWSVQLCGAALVAFAVVLFTARCLVPPCERAIASFPDTASLTAGQLVWAGPTPARLSSSRVLGFVVDLEGRGELGLTGDAQIELTRERLKVRSLLGYADLPWPGGRTVVLDRASAQSWWGAWRPFLVAGAGLATILGLMATWAVLQTIYAGPVAVFSLLLDRGLGARACWKLSGAALVPGAVVMFAALTLYTFDRLNLVGLAFAWALHLVLGWVFLVGAVLRSPRRVPPAADSPAATGNPFAAPRDR